MALYKNVSSQKIAVYAYDIAANEGKTGDAANITAEISKDGAASAATNDANPTELDATDHPGVYLFDMTQAETDADLINLTAVSSTADIVIEPLIIYPMPTWMNTQVAQTGDSYTRLGSPAGASVSADIATVDTVVDGIQTDLDNGTDGLGAIKADTAAIVIDTNELQTDDVPGLIAALNDPTAAAIADAVWDEAKSGHTTSGSFGEEVQAHALSTEISSLNDLSAAEVNTEVDTALSDYDPPTKAELDAGFAALNDPTPATIRAEIDSNSTQLAAIVADTNELQTDDVPGLIAALNDLSAADVNAEVDTALSDIHLDHLLATDYDPASKPGTSTALLNELVENDSGVSRFTANALEQAPSGGGGSPTASEIADAVWDESTTGHTSAGTFGEQVKTDIDAILTDTNELQTDDVPGLIGALNDISAAEVNTEVDTALSDYDAPTKAELDAAFTEIKGATWATTDTLEAIRDRGDTAWLTGNTTTPPTAAAIRAEMDSNSTQLAAIVADTNELQTDDVPGLIAALNDPTAAAIASAVTADLLAEALESGKTLQEFIIDIWSVVVGNASADDANNPTSITYDSPDDSVQRTHALTSTARTVS